MGAGTTLEEVLIWHPHWDVWLVVAFLSFGYAYAIRRIGPMVVEPGEEVAPRRKVVWWYLGVASLWVVSDWPIHDLAEGSSYAFHMVEHLVLTLVSAPLLLLGTPAWLARTLVVGTRIEGLAKFLTRPITAFVLYNAVFVFSHWPVMVELMVTNTVAHFLIHLAMFGSGLVMWVPVLSPIPDVLPRLSRPGQMLYLMAHSVAPIIPASFLTFGRRAIYPVYEGMPNILGVSTADDQAIAGLIMKIAGGLLLWVVITVIFRRWWGEHRAGEVEDLRRWREVEAQLRSE